MTHLPPRISENIVTTLRPISEGAEKWLYRPIKCLDFGFVYLVDYMGNDEAIAQAARVSYGQGTKKVSSEVGLIRYLQRHRHTTPSEMVEFKFHCKMPIFVARQWIRHRTANINEYSGRYSEMLDEFYIPEPSALRKQSAINKQGRDQELNPETQNKILKLLKMDYETQFSHYKEFINFDLAKELARINLSVANYTQWYWKIDLHNLLHFLRLRLDAHAQYEIIKDSVPISFKAFEDYQLNSMTFSGPEVDIVKTNFWPKSKEHLDQIVKLDVLANVREREEFLEKIEKIHFII